MDTNVLGTIAGILTSVAMLPQLIKVIKEKNVKTTWYIYSSFGIGKMGKRKIQK